MSGHYDLLSRQLSESTLGNLVTYTYDDVDNLIEIGYPSGVTIKQTFDDLNRPLTITSDDGVIVETHASYSYRGPWLVEKKTVGQSITQTQIFDAARRPTRSISATGSDVIVDEHLNWDPRGLKVGTFRADQGGRGFKLLHDGAHRLTRAERFDDKPTLTANTEPAADAQSKNHYGFTYDDAQNLTARTVITGGDPETTSLPADTSGRNRPASVDGTALVYDSDGNLTQKGDTTYRYDFRNRLARVLVRGTEVARYEYDAFNRRVRVHRPSDTQPTETTWSGWRELEEYREGQLHWRKTFGSGIDEVVRIDADPALGGTLDQKLVPHYDSTGNVIAWTNADTDEINGRSWYSPFGERMLARADAVAPQITQVIVEDDTIKIEMSEETSFEPVEIVLNRLNLATTGSTAPTKAAVALTVTQPVQEGRRARRRLHLAPTTAPTPGETVELTIQPSGTQDLFNNPLSSAYSTTFTWPDPAGPAVMIEDTTAPEVDELRLSGGHLEISFTERPDATSAASVIEIDGQSVTWTSESDGYTLRTAAPLAEGSYTVRVPANSAVDQAGKGPATTFEETISVTAAEPDAEYYVQPDPHAVPLETFASRLSFHGRPLDLETGLLYFRNRYYDPELGRFITADPLGYVDGPSMYQFAGYGPGNYGDPLGLFDDGWTDLEEVCRLRESFSPQEIRQLREGARNIELLVDMWMEFRRLNTRSAREVGIGMLKSFPTVFADIGARASGKHPFVHDFRMYGALEPENSDQLAGMMIAPLVLSIPGGRLGSGMRGGGVPTVSSKSFINSTGMRQTQLHSRVFPRGSLRNPSGGLEPAASAARSQPHYTRPTVLQRIEDIATPYGPASQELSFAALAARSQVEKGAALYRTGTVGRSGAAEAQFWALEHPLSPGFSNRYGIPLENVIKSNFIETGFLKPGSPFVTRSAPRVGAHEGGGIEVVVPENGVRLRNFSYGTEGD